MELVFSAFPSATAPLTPMLLASRSKCRNVEVVCSASTSASVPLVPISFSIRCNCYNVELVFSTSHPQRFRPFSSNLVAPKMQLQQRGVGLQPPPARYRPSISGLVLRGSNVRRCTTYGVCRRCGLRTLFTSLLPLVPLRGVTVILFKISFLA
jgi:hypothetical protein